MLKKIKILSVPILLGAIFLTIIASAGLYFHFAHAFSLYVDLGLTSASFTLDQSDPQLVHYKATVKNTGQKASDQYYYDYEKIAGRKVSFSILDSSPNIEICSVTIPVIQPNGGEVSVECTSSYVPLNSYSQVEVNITVTAGDPPVAPNGVNIVSYPMYPVLVSTFTQVPPYYNLNDKLNPAQTFTVNIKNTGFPIRSDINDNFYFNSAKLCKTNLDFKKVNSLTGQDVSCAITPTNNNPYSVIFYSASPDSYLQSPTINVGKPDLSATMNCGAAKKVMKGKPVVCSVDIKNDSIFPIVQSSLTKGLVINGITSNGVINEIVCSDFSAIDIAKLNISGGILTKQCTIPATILTNTTYIDATVTIDPQNIIKESNEGNNTVGAPRIEIVSALFYNTVSVQLFDSEKNQDSLASGVELSFNNNDIGEITEGCITNGGKCSVTLPPGNYQVEAKGPATLVRNSEMEEFQVVDRDVDMQLKVTFKTITSCSDSDGNNIEIQGVVTGVGGGVDYCYDINTVSEYYCSANSGKITKGSCIHDPALWREKDNQCFSGACIQSCTVGSECKTLLEMNTFDKTKCSSGEITFTQLGIGQNCGKTGTNYCVRCKPECQDNNDCKTPGNISECSAEGKEPFCSSEVCGCRPPVVPDFSFGTISCSVSTVKPDTLFICKIQAKLDSVAYNGLEPSSRPKPKVTFSIPGNTIQKDFCTTKTANFTTSQTNEVICEGLKIESSTVGNSSAVNFNINPNQVIPETIITNNNASKDITIDRPATPFIDLTVTTPLSCPAGPFNIGDSISGCSITIKNQGTASTGTAKPITILRYRTNVAGSVWVTPPLDTKTSVSAFAVLGTEKITFKDLKLDTAGSYLLQACVDPNNDIDEGSVEAEGNNCSDPPTSITITTPPLTCSSCGNGMFNVCDEAECYGLGSSCVFFNGFLGLNNKCFTKAECQTYCQGQPAGYVCANNRTTYRNECAAKCEKQAIAYTGQCKQLVDCTSLYGTGWLCGTEAEKNTMCGVGKGSLEILSGLQTCKDLAVVQSCINCSVTRCYDSSDCANYPSCSTNQAKQCSTSGECECKDVVAPPSTECIDSDGGKNYFVAGVTQGLGDDAKKGVFNDYCDPKDSSTLYEYYCLDTTAAKEQVKCSYGCEGGACKKLPPAGGIFLPDLTVTTALTCPKTSYNIGDPISGCSVTIKNQGTADTTVKPATILHYYKTFGTAWTPLNTKTSVSILGKNLSEVINFDSFKFGDLGTYAIRACVDPIVDFSLKPNGDITESNEGNNCSGEVSIEIKTLPIIPPVATTTPPVATTTPPITKCSTTPGSNNCASFPCGPSQTSQCLDGICKCTDVVVPPQTIDCKLKYNPAYWCSSYVDWTKQCADRADPNAIKQEMPCNADGGSYCVTCASTPKPPSVCSDCGKGIFNTCDIKECYGLGKDCVFSDGKCFVQNTKEIIILLPSDKETKMTIPAGTFIEDVTSTVTILGIDSVDISGLSDLGVKLISREVVDFSIKNANGNEIHNFANPITIQIPYTDEEIKGYNEDNLKIYIYSEETKKWEGLSTEIDKKNKILKAQTSHFSGAGAGVDSSPCDPCDTDSNTTLLGDCVAPFTCIDGQCKDNDNLAAPCSLTKFDNPDDLINNVSKWIFTLALIIAPLMILLGGFYMLTAAGEPARSTKGKTIITWAIIGLAVILTAKAFISIITSVLK